MLNANFNEKKYLQYNFSSLSLDIIYKITTCINYI
jgi:hypothetical protein